MYTQNKVLMIVQNNFTNDVRVIKEANALGQNGYKVKVLALHSPGLKENEKYEHFEVKRIHLSTREKLSKTNRFIQLIKYIEFYHKCIREAKAFNPNIVHIHDLAPLPIGVKLKEKLECKLIYDSHELWSQSSGNSANPSMLNKVRDGYEKKFIHKVDTVITVSDSIARHLENVYKLKKTVNLVRNIPYFKEFEEKFDNFRQTFAIKQNEKIVLYQGGVAKGRGIEQLIEAIPLLEDHIKVVVLGNGTLKDNLKSIVIEKNLSNRIFFHDAVSPDVLYRYTNSADVGISLIQNICLSYYYSLPNKMFEFIQAELPVVCSDFPDMKKIVESYGVGETVDSKNIEGLAATLNCLLANSENINQYKENCRRAKRELSWEQEEKKLLEIYHKMY